VSLLIAACSAPSGEANRPYLHYAVETAAWLRGIAVRSDSGTSWPDDALHPDHTGIGLAEGVSGKILFFLALHGATGDEVYLETARGGADYLLAALPGAPGNADVLRIGSSLYGGVAGVAFTLAETASRTGDHRYREGALRAVQLLQAQASRDAEGAWWSTYNDVLNGNAGTGLVLLYAARQLQHEPSLRLAIAAGEKLIARGMADRGGVTWKLREDRDFILPNFSHGAAGIGYFLAELYRATERPDFLDAALASARYLEAVARTDGGTFLVPYGWPDAGWERPYDIGWAHGPAGTARFFYDLWRITGDQHWLDRVRQSARGILASGLLGVPARGDFGTEPFRIDRRFALGSVAEFFMDLYGVTREPEDLDVAVRLTEHIAGRATRDSAGMRWRVPRYSFMDNAGAPAEFTGYFYGSAGHGLLMLQLDAALRGEDRPMPLPDNPFDR
jgi:lantibiotic modifying enzyme